MRIEIGDAERHDLLTGVGLVHEQQRDANGLDTDPEQVARLRELERKLQDASD